MEITSFVLGMLTITAVLAIAVVVLGIVRIYKQKEQIKDLQDTLGLVERNASDWVSKLEDQMCRNLDEVRREYSSYVDSRIDKLQSKKEANK
jgi:hypothetical protein